MPDFSVPYFSGTELTSMPGNASLGGAKVLFDPSNKNPAAPLQNTFERIDAQNFQKSQQDTRFRHDLLTRSMEMEDSFKRQQWMQQLKDRDTLYGMMQSTGMRGPMMKGEGGQPMGMSYLPEDQKLLEERAAAIRAAVFDKNRNSSSVLYSPEFQTDLNRFQNETANATARKKYLTEAQILLAQTADPVERAALEKYMSTMESTPLSGDQRPMPYQSGQYSFKPLVDVSKLKDEDLEEYESGRGTPRRLYDPFLSTMDGGEINQGFGVYKNFMERLGGSSPAVYERLQKQVNDARAAMGQEPIDLGGIVTKDNKIAFDASTREKQIDIARKFLYAAQLTHNAYVKDYTEDEMLDRKKTLAEIAAKTASTEKDRIETLIKKKELALGKSTKPTAEELKQKRDLTAVKSVYKDVVDVFDASHYTPVSRVANLWWHKNGVPAENYNIYPVPVEKAGKFVGIEGPEQSTSSETNGVKSTSKQLFNTLPVQNVYLLQDKNTGAKEMAFVKNGSVVARVPERQALINGVMANAKFQPSQYLDQTAWIDELYGSAETAPQAEGPAEGERKMEGGKRMLFTGGQWKVVKGRDGNGNLVFE